MEKINLCSSVAPVSSVCHAVCKISPDVLQHQFFYVFCALFVCAVCSEIVSLHKFVRKRIKKIRYA